MTAMLGMRILVLSQDLPFPPIGGGQLRTHHLVRALAARHRVTLAGFYWGECEQVAAPFAVEVAGVPWSSPPAYQAMRSSDPMVAQRAFEYLANETDEPWFVSCYQSPRMDELLQRLGRQGFDLVLIEHTYMARFLRALPQGIPKILDMHNVHTLMAQRDATGRADAADSSAEREVTRTLCFERAVASQCDVCVTCSKIERDAARRLLDLEHVEVLANGVDVEYFTPRTSIPERGYLLFTGLMNYEPNVEAVRYFATEILPAVSRVHPGAVLHIVGANPSREVCELASEHVVVHGAVPDVRPYYERAAVVVVPLLHGGGTRLKILEAAASGKGIVTTSLGVEGLQFRPDIDIVRADTPQEFGEAVITVIGDRARQRRLGENARRAALPYDWGIIGEQLCRIVEHYSRSPAASKGT